MAEDEEDAPSFRVQDRRRFDDSGNARSSEASPRERVPDSDADPDEPRRPDPGARASPGQAAERADGGPPSPEEGSIGFSELVLSVATTALAYLGREPDAPDMVPGKVNLPAARQNIDILGMLQIKTRGNLQKEEEDLLNTLLYELRTLYLEAAESAPRAP